MVAEEAASTLDAFRVDSITCGGRNHLSELTQVKKKWQIRTFSAFHSFACQRNVANMLMVVRIRQIIVSTAGSRLALSKIQDNSVAKICKSTECNHDHTLYRRASARSVQRRKAHNFYLSSSQSFHVICTGR